MSSFEKFKSFWKSKSDTADNQSFVHKTQNFIVNTLNKPTVHPPCQDTSQFNNLLDIMSARKKPHQKHNNQSRTRLYKPEHIQKCLKTIQPNYLLDDFELNKSFFQISKHQIVQKQTNLQDNLDEIDLCLFNQVSNRFDEVLSVLRTIQSLQFIVEDNRIKLRSLRCKNMANIDKVTQKQIKILRIQRKLKNIQNLKLIAQKLKQYKDLTTEINVSSSPLSQNTGNSIIYKKLEAIIKQKQDISKLLAGHHFEQNIHNVQENLKNSFCDKLNQQIYNYLTEYYPYQPTFWKKFQGKSNMFEQKTVLQGTTMLLDQSIMTDDQIIINVKLDDKRQSVMLQSLKNAWKNSHYNPQSVNEKLKKQIITRYLFFIQQFRNKCDEACKNNEIEVSNPSLANLLSEICPKFCTKAFNYYFDLQKNMLGRISSVVIQFNKFIRSQQLNQQHSLQQKQQLQHFRQGFISILSHICQVMTNKLIQLIQMKFIHQAMDIFQLKQIIDAFTNYQKFIQKYFPDIILNNYFTEENMSKVLCLQTIKTKKQEKIRSYLNRMHKNIVNVQLKQKLEDQEWIPTDVPTYYYDSLHFLLTGQSLNLRRNRNHGATFVKNVQKSVTYQTSVLMESMYMDYKPQKQQKKVLSDFRIIRNQIFIKGKSFKVTETVLLIVQIIEDYMTLAHNFPTLKQQIGTKINQFLRAYHSSSFTLIVNKGATAFKAFNSKVIRAKHLAISSVSLCFILVIIDLICERIQIYQIENLKKSYQQHIFQIHKILRNMLSGKVATSINQINMQKIPSKGTEIIVTNTKIMYEILSQFYDRTNLQKVFTIQILECYMQGLQKLQIKSKKQAEYLKSDIGYLFDQLDFLQDCIPEFNQFRIKSQQILFKIHQDL